MGNMNPELMKLINTVDLETADEGMRQFVELVEDMNAMNAEDYKTWPWTGHSDPDRYFKIMRALVGHTPMVSSVGTAVVLNKQMLILLEQRSDNSKWSLPSGYLEPKETLEDCVVRELEEETGLYADPARMRLLANYSGSAHRYPTGDIVYSVKSAYVIKNFEGELRTNYESLQLRWFPLDAIPSNVSGSTRRIVCDILARYEEISEW